MTWTSGAVFTAALLNLSRGMTVAGWILLCALLGAVWIVFQD